MIAVTCGRLFHVKLREFEGRVDFGFSWFNRTSGGLVKREIVEANARGLKYRSPFCTDEVCMGQGGRGQFSCYPGREYLSPDLQITGKHWTRAEMPSSAIMKESASEASTSGSVAYIEHTVTRLDTLAGVAIKYGIEVADVKRFNGLTTDLQMFALKTLRIPTPGRHPPSSPTQFKSENLTASSRLHRVSTHDFQPSSNGKHMKPEKTKYRSTMELLRGYYDLPPTSKSGIEYVEMTTIHSSNETGLDVEGFLPMSRPPNSPDSREFSTLDYKPNRCGYVRESCNNLLDSCWSVQSSHLAQPSHLLKSGKNLVSEGDSSMKVTPIRRRARGEFGSDDTLDVSERVNFPKRDPAPRLKDPNSSVPYARFVNPAASTTTDWHNSNEGLSGIKTIGAALLGGKEAVEGLLSKVMTTANSTTLQEAGKPFSERVPSTGSFSVLEGITSVYRQAKSALD